MNRYGIGRMILVLSLGVTLAWSALGVGCNPLALNSIQANRHVPSTPGANPFIVLRFSNSVVGPDQNTTELDDPAAINFRATWRYAGRGKDGFSLSGSILGAGEDIGWTLPCDVTVLTVGDVDDLKEWGAWISFNPPGTDPVRTPLPPFGKLLANGIDFRCGDVVTFMLQPDNSNSTHYSVTYRVDSGANEKGPYTGPDTFANMDRMNDHWSNQTGFTTPVP